MSGGSSCARFSSLPSLLTIHSLHTQGSNIVVIDLDEISKSIFDPSHNVYNKIVAEFLPQMKRASLELFNKDWTINRENLGKVSKRSEAKRALRKTRILAMNLAKPLQT